MTVSKQEQDLYGKTVQAAVREENCVIYRIEDETGEAILTKYQVYPGIALVYNDIHKQELETESRSTTPNMLEINHCREGRIEFETLQGDYVYIKKNDMAVNTKSGVKNYSYFPQSHYHGVTIEIDMDKMQEEIPGFLQEFGVNPMELKEKFCGEEVYSIFHEKQEFEHLFEELYCVPEKIRIRYYKLKVIEIMLFLMELDVDQEKMSMRYYNKEQVAVIKEAHSYIIAHLDEKITIDGLAQKFHISATSLKSCFREVYGNSIYAYLKEYRIEKATELLRNTSYDIGRIAGMVGYDNASKFAKSFHSIIGINPREYRKSV